MFFSIMTLMVNILGLNFFNILITFMISRIIMIFTSIVSYFQLLFLSNILEVVWVIWSPFSKP